jgi:hypothetical protein
VGKDYSFAGRSFKKWKKKTGHDRHSFIGDPGFENAENFDFSIISLKMMKKTGFHKFDYSKAGVYGSDTWKQKAKLSDNILSDFEETIRRNMNQ